MHLAVQSSLSGKAYRGTPRYWRTLSCLCGTGAEVETLLHGLIGSSRKQDGRLFNDLHREAINDYIFVILDGWRSKAAFDAHASSAHVARMLVSLVMETETQLYVVIIILAALSLAFCDLNPLADPGVFRIDWDTRTTTCPQEHESVARITGQDRWGTSAHIGFAKRTCSTCLTHALYTRARTVPRNMRFREPSRHEAI